ncbi:fimbria/pilus outer membrane usher protein [Parasphingopyxis marina]|uniref:Fimbria/pilus outer membrane usher protein n=1 Tax=Parasphingopyxis marina TaxID=2761622 RepID=A0A842I350_9SPHN|nr:fimbria/pilus outer membrane usher protein [Parasphingopyxis marina]MBC2778760.1 fimbria/pilus outer membrane usher protein [Parasphingopyxis marina]
MQRAGLAALAGCLATGTATPAKAWQPSTYLATTLTTAAQSRDMSFTVPLVHNQQVRGDVLIQVAANGDVAYESVSLRREVESLLNDAGRQRLDNALSGSIFVSPETLAAAGFEIRFDQNRLEIVVDNIDGDFRPVGTLGTPSRQQTVSPLPTIEPADFSAFLNINGNFDYDETEGMRNPEIYVFGATRFQNVVVELDGAFTDQFDGDYRFYRRSVRAIYDRPDQYQRISAGDLRPDTIPLLRTPYIGGAAIERRRQTFEPFLPISRLGGQEVYLDSRSEVDVLINGVEYQTFQLEAGRYDLANLPLQFGSNDVQLVVRDSAGRRQTINYDYFFEPLDLDAGDYEYVFSVGAVANELSFEPDYSDDIAVVGYYRKAFSDAFILGGGVQLTEDIQIAAAELTVVPQVIPGVFDLQAGASTGNGTGYAFRGSYRWRSSGGYENRRQLSLTVDYESANYQTLGELIPRTNSTLNLSASYTQSFSLNTYGSAGLNYTRQGGGRPDRTVAYAEVVHRLNDRFRLTGGVEYGDDEFYSRNFGVRLGVSVLFGGRHRANADYRSRTETFRATVARGADDHVGSWGYDVGFTDTRGDTSADASVDYIGNRFEARGSVFTNGPDIGGITNQTRARLQLGTSIAFADGTFGIGRPINDSFAVAQAHPSLDDREVITGRTLRNDQYYARSGILGAAVQSDISSYSEQNIQYDVAGLATAYDIGDGLVRVDPPFHSGYKIVVGNDRFVSAIGNLLIDGEPVALATGRVTSTDDEGFETQPFFTNSVGRFGIIGLAPGKTYLVTIAGTGRVLSIEVPEENEGLYRMGTVELVTESE